MASPWRIPLLILLLLLSVFSDWAILAPVFTIWFYAGWGNRKRMITAYGVGAVLFVLFNYGSYAEKWQPDRQWYMRYCLQQELWRRESSS